MAVLTDEKLIEIIRMSLNEGMSHAQIALAVGCGKSTIGDFLRKESHKDFWVKYDEKPIADGYTETRHAKIDRLKGKSFVFASAQNNTFVHSKFLESIKHYLDENDAQLIVGTFHYNKNAYQKGDDSDGDCWFDPKITEYIVDDDIMIADDLMWCGSLDILPTAVTPLSGFHSYTRNASGIFPHAKCQLQSLPTAKHSPAKMLYTTGALTKMNYIQRKAGQKAEFHHVFGAIAVTVDKDGIWHARQLNAESDTGCFYDLDKYYTPEGVEHSDCVEAINWGDIHAAKADEDVSKISWGAGKDSIINVLKPKKQFVHDLFDMQGRNHHGIKNPYFRYSMYVNNVESVKDEILLTTKTLEGMHRDWSDVYVVQSNHDLALKRWLSEQDYRLDPVNAEFFLELQLESYRAISSGDSLFDVFEYACKKVNPNISNVRFLKEDESFIICGEIECGQHGHNGNNGSRGSVRSFQIQGNKINSGHTHAATIIDGVYIAGVSGKLDMGYNVGGSSWSHSHIITYKNGKRAIITIRGDKWR